MAASAPSDDALARAVSLLEERLRPLAVMLYGSRASGPQSAASDFDIGVLFSTGAPDAFALAAASTELEELLGGNVDLVALDDASPILRMEALRQHRLLLNRDPEHFERFVVRTLQEYFDLKRVREPIERALFSTETR